MFDFFGLSRELRDLIYEHALVTERSIYHGQWVHVRVTDLAMGKLLLVNRQFRDEYTENSYRRSALTFVDIETDLLEPIPQEASLFKAVPEQLRATRSVHFKLWLTCDEDDEVHARGECNSVGELDVHQRWVRRLVSQVLSPKVVTVTLYLHHDDQIEKCGKFLPLLLDSVTDIPKLRELTIARADSSKLDGGPGVAEIAFRWDSRMKTLQSVEEADGEKTLPAVRVSTCKDAGTDRKDAEGSEGEASEAEDSDGADDREGDDDGA